MCVDLTDLNNECPKDSYPLPAIDRLVNSSTGHKVLNFMDAFLGYNQNFVDLADQEQTLFITKKDIYCYKVMSFG